MFHIISLSRKHHSIKIEFQICISRIASSNPYIQLELDGERERRLYFSSFFTSISTIYPEWKHFWVTKDDGKIKREKYFRSYSWVITCFPEEIIESVYPEFQQSISIKYMKIIEQFMHSQQSKYLYFICLPNFI